MKYKSMIAAGLAALVALLATPALAQKADNTPICANCHEQPHNSIALTAHGARNDAAGSMCQACHGDASAHVQDPMKNRMVNRFKTDRRRAGRDLPELSRRTAPSRVLGIGQ